MVTLLLRVGCPIMANPNNGWVEILRRPWLLVGLEIKYLNN